MSLLARDLGLDYGRLRALDAVTAEARPGRITALIGPNAAGKSTMLRCLFGALRPSRGAALLDGRPAHRVRAGALARRLAYVAQRSTVGAAFTVRQVVELGRYALPADPRRVEQALRRLDLEAVADRPYPALSVGQQQRASLARAVAQLSPDGHLLLDEPTSAMDLRHARDAMRLLRELADGGATVIMAVHDLSIAASAADDCWLLSSGRLVAAGAVREVMDLDRLQEIFQVGFQWIDRADGPAILLPADP